MMGEDIVRGLGVEGHLLELGSREFPFLAQKETAIRQL